MKSHLEEYPKRVYGLLRPIWPADMSGRQAVRGSTPRWSQRPVLTDEHTRNNRCYVPDRRGSCLRARRVDVKELFSREPEPRMV
jgi:hypothetical protein